MIEILKRESIYLLFYFNVLFAQIVWYWVAGMVIGSAISVFGKEPLSALFVKMRNTKLGLLGVIPASIIGIASPLCMYGTIPIAASFSQKGMRDDWLAAFMVSSILLNPQLLIYSAALGTPALVTRVVSCFACGITAGVLVRIFFRHKQFFSFDKFEKKARREDDLNPALRYLKSLWRNVRVTGPYFLAGIILAALFQRYVPQRAFASLFGSGNRAFGILMGASLGVPLYACGGGTIPLLQSLMAHGMSLGSAAAFMITGQAMKITNLGAVKIVLGMRNFLLYLSFAALFAVLTGVAADILISPRPHTQAFYPY